MMFNSYHQHKKDPLGFHFQVALKVAEFVGAQKQKHHYTNVNQKDVH